MYFLEEGTPSKKLLLQMKNFFRSRYLLKTVTSSKKLVPHNHFHSIYTWRDFSLTVIYYFTYTMIWSDFEIQQFFVLFENSKQCINNKRICYKCDFLEHW